MATETQGIVLGDGKYVEERCVPVGSTSAAQLPRQEQSPQDDDSVARVAHDISAQIALSRQGTTFYAHYSELLAGWALKRPTGTNLKTTIEFTRNTTLTAALRLTHTFSHLHSHNSTSLPRTTLGVLSFASRKRPGGGFLHGGDDQEEAIARLSSLVASLAAPAARDFYKEHKKYWVEDGSGLQDHSMVYSPGVVVFRNDVDGVRALDARAAVSDDSVGGEFISPFTINVLSSVPVNAAAVRDKHTILPSEVTLFEDGIRSAMKERMARALHVFEERGDKTLVLGAFGCGSNENKVEMVARVWAELLVCGDSEGGAEGKGKRREARFKNIFERVVFAVPGKLFEPFKEAFEMRVFEEELALATMDGE
ncbi:hypothetical protein B0H21DRAFT_780095 [Amylocystis lapponica]|nr:hypothetical protein B0H21DRAFT_780095 [Amylocystis lapponica]